MDPDFSDISVPDNIEIVCSDDISIKLEKKHIKKCRFFDSCSFLFGSPIPCTCFTSFDIRKFIDYMDDVYGIYSVLTPTVYEVAIFFDVYDVINSAPRMIACEITKRIHKSDGIQKLAESYDVDTKQPYKVQFLSPVLKRLVSILNHNEIVRTSTKAILSNGNIVVCDMVERCINIFNVDMCIERWTWLPLKKIKHDGMCLSNLFVYSGGFITNTNSDTVSIYDNDANIVTTCKHECDIKYTALSRDNYIYTFLSDGTICMWNINGTIVGKHYSGRERDIHMDVVLFEAYTGGHVLMRFRETRITYIYIFKDRVCHEQCITDNMYASTIPFDGGFVQYDPYYSRASSDKFHIHTKDGINIECCSNIKHIRKIIPIDEYLYVFYVSMTCLTEKTCTVYNNRGKIIRDFHICTSDYYRFNVALYGNGKDVLFIANCDNCTILFDAYGRQLSIIKNNLSLCLDDSNYAFGFFDNYDSQILTFKPCLVEAIIHSSALEHWSSHTTTISEESYAFRNDDADDAASKDIEKKMQLCELSLFGKNLRMCILDILT